MMDRLDEGCSVRVRVWGRSMAPVLAPGAELEVAACGREDVRPGDVVLVLRGADRTALHRVIRVEAGCVVTRGDGLRAEDPPVSRDDVIGRAIGVPLGRSQLRVRDALARPLNRGLGASAHALVALRSMVAGSRLRAPLVRGLDAFAGARRVMQPYKVVSLGPDWAHRLDELERWATGLPTEGAREAWRKALEGRGDAGIAIDARGRPVGWLLASLGQGDAWELRLWVEPGRRRLGIGTALFDRTLARAASRGCELLRARQHAEFWAHRGFRARADGEGLERQLRTPPLATT
jgi:GNAT superfamily N-acetyltransferase